MTVTIADVLHRAADHWLAVDRDDWYERDNTDEYSCCAVASAAYELGVDADDILDGLMEMGCPTGSHMAFDKFGYQRNVNAEIQGARYGWLKFAALIAEEQGV